MSLTKTINLLVLISCALGALSSCVVSKPYSQYNTGSSLVDGVFHKYKGKSSVNQNSDFGPINRKIEFEYLFTENDSIVEVNMMLTSGFNEGNLLEGIEILFQDEVTLSLETSDLVSREYIEDYSYNTNTPVQKSHTISDPGGVDVVVGADGTHSTVHRAATTKVVYVTENQSNSYAGSKSQIFNQAKFALAKKNLELKPSTVIASYRLQFQNESILINLNKVQRGEVFYYLKERLGLH